MYIISLLNRRIQRLNLYFPHENESQDVMDIIMLAEGFSCQLEQYEIKDQIGSRTLKGVCKSTSKSYIIKVITRQVSDSFRSLSILNLFHFIQPLKQEELLSLQEHILDREFIYFVSSFHQYGNVIQELTRSKISQLNENELRDGARTLSLALNSIHKLGYLHGDVRLQSIFLRKDKHSSDKLSVVLGNYDFCCPIDMQAYMQPYIENDESRMLYLAPEVILSEECGSTPASEVWSLGVTLYVLATGQYPFSSVQEICEACLVWPSTIPSSPTFKAMITSMLQKDQELRPLSDEIVEHPWFNEDLLSFLTTPTTATI